MADEDDGVIIPVEADVDSGSFKTAGKSIDELKAHLQSLLPTLQAYTDGMQAGRKYTDAETAAADKLQDEFLRTAQALEKLNEAQADNEKIIKKQIQASKELATSFGRVGQVAMIAGAAILGGMFAAASKYAAAAKESEQASREWNFSMMKMDTAANSLGRSMATVLNPALAEAAKQFGNLADLVAANPSLMTGLAGVGGAALVTGGAAKGITTGLSMAEGAGVITAATAASIAAVAIPAIIAVGGIALIVTAVRMYQEQNPPSQAKADALQAALAGAQWGGQSPYAGQPFGQPALNPIHDTTKKPAPGPAGPTGMFALQGMERGIDTEKLSLFNNSQLANRRIEVQMEADKMLLAGQETFEKKRASIEAETQRLRESFILANQKAEQNYLAQRAELTRSAQIADQRREEDHQRALTKIQKDSGRRIKELAAERDAYGIAMEKQRAADEIATEETNNETEKQRTAQDNAERLRQLDQQYARERAMRLQEYQYNLQARQAEMVAARNAYVAIQTMAAQMLANLNSYAGASVGTASAAAMSPTTNTNTGNPATSNTNVTITGGNLSVAQVRQIAIDAANQSVQTTLRRVLAVPQ